MKNETVQRYTKNQLLQTTTDEMHRASVNGK